MLHKRTSCAQKPYAPAVQTCVLEAANEKRVGLKGEDELSLSFTAVALHDCKIWSWKLAEWFKHPL